MEREREQECLIHIFIGMNHHPYRFHLKIFTYDKQPMNKHNPNSSEKTEKNKRKWWKTENNDVRKRNAICYTHYYDYNTQFWYICYYCYFQTQIKWTTSSFLNTFIGCAINIAYAWVLRQWQTGIQIVFWIRCLSASRCTIGNETINKSNICIYTENDSIQWIICSRFKAINFAFRYVFVEPKWSTEGWIRQEWKKQTRVPKLLTLMVSFPRIPKIICMRTWWWICV